MATTEQVRAGKRNVKKAKRRDLPGRSKMGRAELARALGHQ
jgi:hypothetical protein